MATKVLQSKSGKNKTQNQTSLAPIYKDMSVKGTQPFKKGNPGRPPGIQNHKARIINSLLDCWDEDAAAVFRAKLRSPIHQAEALETLLQILGKGKVESLFGDVNIQDNSQTSIGTQNVQNNIEAAKSVLASRTPAERDALKNLLTGMGLIIEAETEEVQADRDNPNASTDQESPSPQS